MGEAVAFVILDALPHLVVQRFRRRDKYDAVILLGQFLRKRALAGTRPTDDECQSRAHRPTVIPSRRISVWGPTASGGQCIVDYLKRLKRQDIPNREQRGHDKHGHRRQLIHSAVDISRHAAEPSRRELSHDQRRRAGHGQQHDTCRPGEHNGGCYGQNSRDQRLNPRATLKERRTKAFLSTHVGKPPRAPATATSARLVLRPAHV